MHLVFDQLAWFKFLACFTLSKWVLFSSNSPPYFSFTLHFPCTKTSLLLLTSYKLTHTSASQNTNDGEPKCHHCAFGGFKKQNKTVPPSSWKKRPEDHIAQVEPMRKAERVSEKGGGLLKHHSATFKQAGDISQHVESEGSLLSGTRCCHVNNGCDERLQAPGPGGSINTNSWAKESQSMTSLSVSGVNLSQNNPQPLFFGSCTSVGPVCV